ncbi:hypothetical protein WNY78_14940 [Psychroserpens sp. AS72]|uniref:hypothetical protein n=1 Tax=Psychroserpens sp. AS72 TaxID=3135775 RepID=UPI003178D3A1
MGMIRYYDIGHAEVFIFDDFLIKQVKEGEVIDIKEADEFIAIVKKHFNGKNMAYISNRVTSFSINPLIYKKAESIPNMVAIAVITLSEKIRASAIYESQFFEGPFDIFDNLSDAIAWVHKIIEKENEEQSIET